MPDPHLTVWYNTRCPVCDAAINRQRNKLIARVKAGRIAFRDINLEPLALAAAHGTGVGDVRRRSHAIDAAGCLLVGADVALRSGVSRRPRTGSLLGHAVARPADAPRL